MTDKTACAVCNNPIGVLPSRGASMRREGETVTTCELCECAITAGLLTYHLCANDNGLPSSYYVPAQCKDTNPLLRVEYLRQSRANIPQGHVFWRMVDCLEDWRQDKVISVLSHIKFERVGENYHVV